MSKSYRAYKDKPLDLNRKNVITSALQRVYNDSLEHESKHRLPIPYLDKTFAFNEVFCWKCGEVIQLGSFYNSSTHSTNGSIKKYYHRSCYERMFY